LFRFGQVSKSEQAPTPTHARRHPAFAEFCKACTRPSSGRMAGEAYTVAHSRRISSPPYVSAPPRHQLCGFWTVVQITHTHTREEALLENSPKVHFGTPHLHARGGDVVRILTSCSAAPDPARASRSSPAPRGGRGSIGDSPERRGDEPPSGTVDSWTDIWQNSDKSVPHPHARYIVSEF
jgi:hypothetical protein